MSRPLRIQYPGAVYHVMNRGNARQLIFQHPDHYSYFKGYGALSRQFGVAPSRISGIMKEKELIDPKLEEMVAAYLKSEK